MSKDNLYKILEEKFVKQIGGSNKKNPTTIFSGFTFENAKGGGTVYPVLIQRPEKGGAWCFYSKREKTIQHIPIDEFVNRYLQGSIIGVRGRFKEGGTSSITFSKKELLKLTPEFSSLLLDFKTSTKKINNNSGSLNINSSVSDGQLLTRSSLEIKKSNAIDETKVSDGELFLKLKRDMLSALDKMENRLLGQDVDALVKRRVGQSFFRSLLEAVHGVNCHVSMIDNRKLLIASHIVPWSKSTGDEKTDPDNGLLLAINCDLAPKNWSP